MPPQMSPDRYLQSLLNPSAGWSSGWDAGAEDYSPLALPSTGFQTAPVGFQTAGELEAMGYEMGAVMTHTGPKAILRPRGSGHPVPAHAMLPPRQAAHPAPIHTKFDNVYSGAGREAGNGFPETAQGHASLTLADGATFSLSFTARQAFVLTSISLNNTAAGQLALGVQLKDLSLSISGQPAGGFPQFGAARFAANCFNRRIEPVAVDTSVLVEFTATAVVAAGTALFEVDILGIRLVAGLEYATRA